MRTFLTSAVLFVASLLALGCVAFADDDNVKSEVKRMVIDEDEDRLVDTVRDSGYCLLIDYVYEGTAADRVGLEEGDIIVKCNGERVKSPRALTQRLSEDDYVPLVLINVRNGRFERATVKPRNGKLGVEVSIVKVRDLARGNNGRYTMTQEKVTELEE